MALPMKPTEVNRPLRVFEKVLQGGLGPGNIGVIMSRHGTGKVAVLTSIAVDKAMDGHNVLHIAMNQSVSDVRAYRDGILHEIEESLAVQDRAETLTMVERHTQIYTYRNSTLTAAQLRSTVRFLSEHAEFKPELIEIQGWPDWREVDDSEVQALKQIAEEWGCEIWATVHTQREDVRDDRGVPDFIARIEHHLAVVVTLEPEAEQIPIRFLKVHGEQTPQNVHLEFDPTSMLIRWR